MNRLAPWLVVAGLALAYPIATLAGGGPDFPSRDDWDGWLAARPASDPVSLEVEQAQAA